jgi:hypothetical protein
LDGLREYYPKSKYSEFYVPDVVRNRNTSAKLKIFINEKMRRMFLNPVQAIFDFGGTIFE